MLQLTRSHMYTYNSMSTFSYQGARYALSPSSAKEPSLRRLTPPETPKLKHGDDGDPLGEAARMKSERIGEVGIEH